MFCSNCGFENPPDHRFCGMCGTPMPQRPITAPGAQSTVGFTRLPVEAQQTTSSTGPSLSGTNVTAAIEAPEAPPSETAGPSYFSQAQQAESLEQFVAGFHYTPPTEEDEVTMTGAKPVLDSTSKYEPPVPASLSEEPGVVELPANPAEPVHTTATGDLPPAESITEQPSLLATEPPPFATRGMRERTPERSRFLDFSEPAAEEAPAPSPASIGGPSFLGLSDAPATSAYVSDDAAAAPRSHWRAWTALIVICIFAGLGLLEWRAEKSQSGNGPIGIMRMQIQRLKGKKGAIITPSPPSEATTEPAQSGPTSQPNGGGPQMQVAPPQKPQIPNPQPANDKGTTPGKAVNPGAASNASAPAPPATKMPSASTPTSSTSETGPAGGQKPQSPPAKAESASAASGEGANSSPKSAAQGAESAESNSEKPLRTTSPGAEELAKAANASDAAAASAWLWKSVGKGNPEAPIRLANMYIKGDGVPQSCDQALVLLRSAAAKENAPARSRLGSLYATGTCVPRNRVRAYQYMSEALEANPNAGWPRQFRQQLWTQMSSQERQQAQASQ